jgi:ubiquinone/menaquinone biosynthesis C-methylase UbiE
MTGPDPISHEPFVNYYAKASQTAQAYQRFRSLRASVLRVLERTGSAKRPLEVADIGCGAGTQSLVWAELGHHPHGIDVNERLLELADKRARDAGYVIETRVGSAVKLPWSDASMDVCLVIELLEHVAHWEACLSECQRVLKPGGVLFLTTSNKLCPIQQEFDLPLYSWQLLRLARNAAHPRLHVLRPFRRDGYREQGAVGPAHREGDTGDSRLQMVRTRRDRGNDGRGDQRGGHPLTRHGIVGSAPLSLEEHQNPAGLEVADRLRDRLPHSQMRRSVVILDV